MNDTVKKFVARLSRFSEMFAKTLCVICIAALFILCIEQVFCRFVLRVSVGYVDELSRYLFILSVFVGSCLAVRDEEHFSLDILASLLQNKPRILAGVRILVQLMIGLFLFFMIRSGMILIDMTKTQYSSYLHIPMSVMYWLFPVCGVWMGVYVVTIIFRQIKILIHGEDLIPDEKEMKGGGEKC